MRRLAELAGVSPSLISDVERGRVEPSISVLKRLAGALDTTLIYFFSEAVQTQGRVVRARAPSSPAQQASGRDHLRAARAGQKRLARADLRPLRGGRDDGRGARHPRGRGVGDGAQGRLKVWVGDEIYFLDPGDSISFPSTTPHRLANAATKSRNTSGSTRRRRSDASVHVASRRARRKRDGRCLEM